MLERIRTRRAAAAAETELAEERPRGVAVQGGDPFAVGYRAAEQAGPGASLPEVPAGLDGPAAAADFASGFRAYSELFTPGLELQISGYRAAGVRSIDSPFTSPDDVDDWAPRGMTAGERRAFEEGWRSYWDHRQLPGPRPGTPSAGQKMRWLTPPSGPRGQEVAIVEIHSRGAVDVTDNAGRRHRTHLGTLAYQG